RPPAARARGRPRRERSPRRGYNLRQPTRRHQEETMTSLPNPLPTRRQALLSAGCGFGYLALAGLLGEGAAAAPAAGAPLAAKPPPHRARARRVIFIFMQGGPSHVDTFDYKPRLERDDGKMLEFDDARTLAKERRIVQHRVMKSPWKFRQHGGS